jgi:membrane protein implicated in regulation of membrane protease activity
VRDRDLLPVAVLSAVVCCGTMALIAALVGGVALAAIGRFTVISAAGLGVVVAIAWWLDRRRHRHDRTRNADGRPAELEGARR